MIKKLFLACAEREQNNQEQTAACSIEKTLQPPPKFGLKEATNILELPINCFNQEFHRFLWLF